MAYTVWMNPLSAPRFRQSKGDNKGEKQSSHKEQRQQKEGDVYRVFGQQPSRGARKSRHCLWGKRRKTKATHWGEPGRGFLERKKNGREKRERKTRGVDPRGGCMAFER